LIDQKTADTFQLPSDIKSGTYVLRTELLALHGNSFSSNPVGGAGPQFYTHCFNVEITDGGNTVPTNTVKFPGGYKREDPGVAFNLRNKAAWAGYVRSIKFPLQSFGLHGTIGYPWTTFVPR
jgi:hypothetical protein